MSNKGRVLAIIKAPKGFHVLSADCSHPARGREAVPPVPPVPSLLGHGTRCWHVHGCRSIVPVTPCPARARLPPGFILSSALSTGRTCSSDLLHRSDLLETHGLIKWCPSLPACHGRSAAGRVSRTHTVPPSLVSAVPCGVRCHQDPPGHATLFAPNGAGEGGMIC